MSKVNTHASSSIVVEDAMTAYRAGQNPPPVFFFCSRSIAEPGRSDPEAILASIVKQLSSLEAGSPLLDPVVKKYTERESEGFASGSLRMEESSDLITQLTDHYPLTIIIIDALDECDHRKRNDLLDELEKILRQSSQLVKIFLSSRDDQDIVCQLQHYPNLEISSDRNSDDIAAFVKEETDRLVQKKRLLLHSQRRDKMKQLVIEKVIDGAKGM